MNRRHLLRSAAVVPVLAAGGAWWRVASAAVSSSAAPPAELFVFDNRFAAAVGAARVMEGRGIPCAGFAGDLTELWYHSLDLRWRSAAMTLAGVTTAGGLFVLETLAADRGMRVVDREPYGRTDDGSEPLYSWTIAPRRSALVPT